MPKKRPPGYLNVSRLNCNGLGCVWLLPNFRCSAKAIAGMKCTQESPLPPALSQGEREVKGI